MQRFSLQNSIVPIVLLVLLLAGCSGQGWQTKDIAGLMPRLAFQLEDAQGREVSAEDYRGRVVALFFGFTHCPDVCPTTLARLAAVKRELGVEEDLLVLFVTVDPARDSQAVLRDYTHAFGAGVTGLRGGQAALEALTRRYRVTFGYGPKDIHGDYPVSHPGAVFVFDRTGHARLLIRDSDSLQAMTADLGRLLRQS